MSAWTIFWGLVVLFSLLSFTYMSVRILIKSIAELKSMFRTLDEKRKAS
ncbi:MAG: hypothetical protein GWP06_01000 [Actinobacteria bacterium]|nr:hypothetical protein [Actinomycetota bacterium]